MAVAPGGMPEPRTCTLPFPSPTLIAVVFCRCWSNGCASSLLYEPPYTEPYVRWCGRTAEVTPPPTRSTPSQGPLTDRHLIELLLSPLFRTFFTFSFILLTLA